MIHTVQTYNYVPTQEVKEQYYMAACCTNIEYLYVRELHTLTHIFTHHKTHTLVCCANMHAHMYTHALAHRLRAGSVCVASSIQVSPGLRQLSSALASFIHTLPTMPWLYWHLEHIHNLLTQESHI